MKVLWTRNADADLDRIWEFIAADKIDPADALADKVRTTATRLGRAPRAGRRGRRPGTRELVVPGTRYILIYEIAGKSIHVLRVLHGAQQWPPKTS